MPHGQWSTSCTLGKFSRTFVLSFVSVFSLVWCPFVLLLLYLFIQRFGNDLIEYVKFSLTKAKFLFCLLVLWTRIGLVAVLPLVYLQYYLVLCRSTGPAGCPNTPWHFVQLLASYLWPGRRLARRRLQGCLGVPGPEKGLGEMRLE